MADGLCSGTHTVDVSEMIVATFPAEGPASSRLSGSVVALLEALTCWTDWSSPTRSRRRSPHEAGEHGAVRDQVAWPSCRHRDVSRSAACSPASCGEPASRPGGRTQSVHNRERSRSATTDPESLDDAGSLPLGRSPLSFRHVNRGACRCRSGIRRIGFPAREPETAVWAGRRGTRTCHSRAFDRARELFDYPSGAARGRPVRWAPTTSAS